MDTKLFHPSKFFLALPISEPANPPKRLFVSVMPEEENEFLARKKDTFCIFESSAN